MIVYLSTKDQFREDVLSNRIEEKILAEFRASLDRSTGEREVASWKNSLPFMDRILADNDIPGDTGVAIEYNIPNTAKRIDFILTGLNSDEKRIAVIIELKQWQKASLSPKDAIVSTYFCGADQETNHPSYQAWSYAMLLEDYNEAVQQQPISLHPCAYLHNCESEVIINHEHYAEYTKKAPAFLKDDARKLREFIKKHVKLGDKGNTMYLIQDGKIRPSKSLTDHLASLLKGNREFYMIDDQKLVYETSIHLAQESKSGKKNVLIVNGGPGTGKSVVAINLLVNLLNQGMLAKYVTKNAAPRAVYESKLAGTLKKSRITDLFVGSGSFIGAENNTFQALIVDEAHRLNSKSGMMRNLGENQIKEIINAASFSVFFLDEDQRIHWKDIGEKVQIINWAATCGAVVTELTLSSQFRCNGSDGYLAWVDNVIQIRKTANPTLENINYEFKVCNTASELRDLVYKRNRKNNKARMVAGYCWDWVSKKKSNVHDIVIPDEDFKARWNLSTDGSLWIVKPDSVSEVGCIHTCQGLELDYVGVILGNDLIARDNRIITDATKRAQTDSSIKGFKTMLKKDPIGTRKKAEEIIKNTYRTLMTRGLKGCYVFSVDPETNAYLQEAAKGAIFPESLITTPPEETLPFRILKPEEVQPYINAVPMFDVEIAAGGFSEDQLVESCDWVELPPHLVVRKDYFVAKVVGESMNLRIPNGSWCLFKASPAGTRQGKILLVQHRDIHDPDYGGQYTIKRYSSEKEETDEGWRHTSITLSPMSNVEGYSDISLDEDQTENFKVIGEFIAIL